MLSELSNLQHELSLKESKLGNYYRQQLQEYHSQQTKAVENCVRLSLMENIKNASGETNSLLFSQQRHDIELTCNRHRLELQRFIKSELTKQMLEYETNIKQIVSNLKSLYVDSNHAEDGALLAATHQNLKVINSSKKTLMTLPLRSPKPKKLGEEYDEENNQYGCDIERITVSSPEFHISSSSCSQQGVQPSTKDLLGSPWNPNTLFQSSRIVKPSPVATVAPIIQQSSSKNMPVHPTVMTRKIPNYRHDTENQKRQEGIVPPQPKRKKDLQKVSKTTHFPPEQTSRYLTRSSKKQQESLCGEELQYLERRFDMGEGEQKERDIHPSKRKAKTW